LAVAAAAVDDVRPLYRTILAFGALAVVILVAGAVEFIYFEPLGQRTANQARIEGVFVYDPQTKSTVGKDQDSFSRDQAFAAKVDWQSLPGDLVVGARWYDSFGDVVTDVGPAPASQLADHDVIAVEVPSGEEQNLPGHYLFVVERYRNGQAVEVLGRRIVLVKRTG
jgi:hypothetical protein